MSQTSPDSPQDGVGKEAQDVNDEAWATIYMIVSITIIRNTEREADFQGKILSFILDTLKVECS